MMMALTANVRSPMRPPNAVIPNVTHNMQADLNIRSELTRKKRPISIPLLIFLSEHQILPLCSSDVESLTE